MVPSSVYLTRHNWTPESAAEKRMAMLTNLKLRTKLFLAVLPLAVMVVVATVYSSVESQESDTAYSLLLDRGIETQKSLTATRALTMRFGMMLYQLIAESNPDRRQSIDG
jgi:hypothetical protein